MTTPKSHTHIKRRAAVRPTVTHTLVISLHIAPTEARLLREPKAEDGLTDKDHCQISLNGEGKQNLRIRIK